MSCPCVPYYIPVQPQPIPNIILITSATTPFSVPSVRPT